VKKYTPLISNEVGKVGMSLEQQTAGAP